MAAVLRRLADWLAPKPLEPLQISFGAHQLDVIFRRHASARRLVLRLNSEGTAAVVTVPRGISRPRAMAFVNRSADWLEARLAQRGPSIVLRPGNVIPLRGVDHEIRHLDLRRGVVTVDATAGVIHVPGEGPHVARRLLDFLKKAVRLLQKQGKAAVLLK